MLPKLRLVESGNSARDAMESETVVQFPQRETSTFEAAWKARQGMMKKRGDGSDKTRKLWERAAKKVGSQRLLEALKRYLKSEKEPVCGFPGLSVWLNGERYDHWLPEAGIVASDGTVALRPVAPSVYREPLIDALGEPFVISYLDPCMFHEDGFITPKTTYAKEKLMEQRQALKAAGIAGLRNKE